jgi:hypothetical protein
MHLKPLVIIAVALAGSAGSAAWAGLAGTNLTLRYDYQDAPSSVDQLTVGAGTEVECTGGGAGNTNVCTFLTAGTHQTVDIGDTTITYLYQGSSGSIFSPVTPNAFNFIDIAPTVTSVGLSSTISGLDSLRLSFSAHAISLDMSGLAVEPGQGYTLAVQAVPEPTTVAMLLAAAPLLAAALRRRRG